MDFAAAVVAVVRTVEFDVFAIAATVSVSRLRRTMVEAPAIASVYYIPV